MTINTLNVTWRKDAFMELKLWAWLTGDKIDSYHTTHTWTLFIPIFIVLFMNSFIFFKDWIFTAAVDAPHFTFRRGGQFYFTLFCFCQNFI